MTASPAAAVRLALSNSTVRTKVLVTCSVGTIGREVVRQLLARGEVVVAADHSDGRTRQLFGPDVTHAAFDFKVPPTWAGALRDAKTVFLVRPPTLLDVRSTLLLFIDFAIAQGVEHIVFLSIAGADDSAHVPHRLVEMHLGRRTVRFTVLRSAFFLQNFETRFLDDLVEKGCLYVPPDDRDLNWVDAREVAEVAASVLVAPDAHRGRSYDLAGPIHQSWDHILATLALVLRRPVRVEPTQVFGYVSVLMMRGMSAHEAAVYAVLHFLLRSGSSRVVDTQMSQLLGRAPLGVCSYLRERSVAWASSTPVGSIA